MYLRFPADTKVEMTQQKHALLIFFLVGILFFLHAAEPVYHIVKKGETLYGIARVYSVSVEELMKANKIRDAKAVLPGTKLLVPQAAVPAAVPAPGTAPAADSPNPIQYIVKKGDTLYSISRQFGTSVEVINKMNSLGSSSIKPGMKLLLPGLASTEKPPETVIQKPVIKPPVVTPIPEHVAVSSRPSATVSGAEWPCAGELSYLQGKLSGVSIKAKGATSLIAVRAGTVISAGPFLTWNNVVFVQAGDGLIYVYGGFLSMRVKAGDAVRKGTELGILSSDQFGTAYFFVFKGSSTIDPAKAPRD